MHPEYVPRAAAKKVQAMEMLRTVSDLMGRVPDVVWAAVIASFLTLSGVWLTNRNSRLQQSAALRHDASQRERERKMSLRKEVYGPAMEAIANAYSALGRMTDLSISYQALADCTGDAGALAKVEVVGTNPTVQAMSALSNEFGAAFLELMLKRMPLVDRQSEIEMMTSFIDKSFNEQARYRELMKQLGISGQLDGHAREAINGLLEFEKDQNAKHRQKRDQLWEQQSSEHVSFTECCIERLAEVSRLVPPALFALREEMELPIDRDAYMKVFNENAARTKAMLQRMIAEIGRFIDD